MDDAVTGVAAPPRESKPPHAQPTSFELYWLPEDPAWRERMRAVEQIAEPTAEAWRTLVALANTRMDLPRTARLDRSLLRLFGNAPPPGYEFKPVRLAVLGSSTVGHLLPAIRVAALRRGFWPVLYEAAYGQYFSELVDPTSGLHRFAPNAVLLALDAYHLARGADAAADAAQAEIILDEIVNALRRCWQAAREAFQCQVIQQTALPVFHHLLGNNEHRLPGAPGNLVARLNAKLRELADIDGVDLLGLDERSTQDGVGRWHDIVLWHRAKQEVGPQAAALYGDMVGRMLAARLGRSFKCLVLDLDNTLWGGVIGDDGLDGIVIGQGSALGEAFAAFQGFARDMAKRGVILAVCSKNDEANALAAFDRHPDMVLKRADIACFVANWDDKATNLRRIAQQLNIGIDSLVFVDDNPFERNLVREALPMVAVPEIPEDPALVAAAISDAGYFESLAITDEDRERTQLYQANLARETLQVRSGDIESFLRGLDMHLVVRRFDQLGLQRIVQLINKTNQFNLTTSRYTESDISAVMRDPRAFGLQLRLLDRFGDNGIIAIVIGRLANEGDLVIDTWLMSCRVLGRQVEPTTLSLIAAEARRLGATRLVGEYRPTAKNGMVAEHYPKLGFTVISRDSAGITRWALELENYASAPTFVAIDAG